VVPADPGITSFKNWLIAVDGVNSPAGKGAVRSAVSPAGEDDIGRAHAATASRTQAALPTTRIAMIANFHLCPIASLLSSVVKKSYAYSGELPAQKTIEDGQQPPFRDR
jgi:hypothetical protein